MHASRQALRRHSVGAMPWRGLFFKASLSFLGLTLTTVGLVNYRVFKIRGIYGLRGFLIRGISGLSGLLGDHLVFLNIKALKYKL